ncbi:MAG: class I SAM-dependent methyltransferase [Planctomycetota bacterium]
MANFPPLKLRFLEALDGALGRWAPSGRFLDFGAGSGDVALHVKSRWKMEGELVEASPEARERLKKDPGLAGLTCHAELPQGPAGAFGLVVAFDVLEHLPDPAATLRGFHHLLGSGGLLAVIIPYRPSTWGWDDEFYGHLRRWTVEETRLALKMAGFEVLEMRDPTFPLYSTLRWLMLRLRNPHGNDVGICRGDPCGRPDDRAPTRGAPTQNDSMAASQMSSLQSSWGAVPAWTRFVPWRLLHRLCDPFSGCLKGDELFVIARKMSPS